jgi:hypothetical protein
MTEMRETVPQTFIRDRIRDLDTKAYYLLVALSFIYGRAVGAKPIKWAFLLTVAVGIIPVQDYIKSKIALGVIRGLKVLGLIAASVLMLYWIWSSRALN